MRLTLGNWNISIGLATLRLGYVRGQPFGWVLSAGHEEVRDAGALGACEVPGIRSQP